MDKVIVSGARLAARIGVSEQERAAAQELVVDVELETDTREAARTDDVRNAIDYAAVHALLAATAAARPRALVETLAADLAGAVLESFPARGVRVLVRKPGALRPQGADWAGVEITRRRDG
ncbi:MAG: 7,8-dihydroneopterin aldolase [Bryobacteraceae bacterium]|nr:MAG: 7,8-dihydroneopterin aldolase [Bryobacteraceae bacterium]